MTPIKSVRIHSNKIGVKTLPTISTTFPFRNDKSNVIPKKAKVNKNDASFGSKPSRKGMMPISKETLPHLGNANKGPIQRYTVKDRIFAKRGDMREASSYILVPASTTAKTPATAIPTSLKTKPSKAIGALVPACCPMEGGKIIFPAPKKIAKIMQDIPAICDNDSFFISLFSFFKYLL